MKETFTENSIIYICHKIPLMVSTICNQFKMGLILLIVLLVVDGVTDAITYKPYILEKI